MLWVKFFFTVFISITTVALADEPSCGQTPIPPKINENIIGGSIAKPFSWPWQVEWMPKIDSSYDFGCGGTIIGKRWILTAGHCVDPHLCEGCNKFEARTGVFNRSSEEFGKIYTVKKFYLHSNYRLPANDIALAELEQDIVFDNHTQPVCLPLYDNDTIVEPNTAWATGWGRIHTYDFEDSDALRQIEFAFVNFERCNKDYDGSINEHQMVCVGGPGLSTCNGDSGGPLVAPNRNGTWYQYGITSFGHSITCNGLKPSVYARVSSYCDFIEETTKGEVTCQDPDA